MVKSWEATQWMEDKALDKSPSRTHHPLKKKKMKKVCLWGKVVVLISQVSSSASILAEVQTMSSTYTDQNKWNIYFPFALLIYTLIVSFSYLKDSCLWKSGGKNTGETVIVC